MRLWNHKGGFSHVLKKNKALRNGIFPTTYISTACQVVQELLLTRKEPGSPGMTTSARNSGQAMVRHEEASF